MHMHMHRVLVPELYQFVAVTVLPGLIEHDIARIDG